MKPKEKAGEIVQRLKKEYPQAKIALHYKSPLELLVATILSAQCTDEMVNRVTKDLFKKYKRPEDYAQANQQKFEREIRSTGFFRNKAKNIIAATQKIVSNFKGKVPQTMEELLTLPGVARKTANIVLSNAFGIVEGIAVDTHVKRLSQRLGLTKNENPLKIEKDLMQLLPRTEWFNFTYLLIDHGRKICDALKPLCDQCVLLDLCPSVHNFSQLRRERLINGKRKHNY